MPYVIGLLILVYGSVFYKSVRALRSLRSGPSDLTLEKEETEFKAVTDRLVGELDLRYLGEFVETNPVISEGYPHHHVVYQCPTCPLFLWFFLLEKEAEQRVAILELDSEHTVTEIPQGTLTWRETWEKRLKEIAEEETAVAIDAEKIGEVVSKHVQKKAEPMIQAYAQSADHGRRRLSWSQTLGLFFKMLGKGKVGVTCDEQGSLTVVARKDTRAPDLDQIGWTIHDRELTALLDLKFRKTTNELEGQKKKSQWLLPASLAAFLASFFGLFDWRTVLLLAAVIFIHELGHWAAMRAFRYEDTSFLFLPFFGGVAMGRKKSPKLYESVLVFLAGPVPGVLLALGLALYWPSPRNLILNQFILMLWIINLINLLPIVPLDGGRIVAATIFSKTPRAEFVFRVITGLALIGFFFKTDDYILLILGVIVLTNTAPTKKVADVCDHFRKQKTSQPTDLQVALETYDQFQFDPNKHVQQIRSIRIDQVFQRMESGGASWGISIFWLVIYLACLLGSGYLGMTRVLG